MHGTDERDLLTTLASMERLSRQRSNFDTTAARETFKHWLDSDRRFDGFDKDRLIARVQECRASGAVCDLSDPRLRGQPARPLERSHW